MLYQRQRSPNRASPVRLGDNHANTVLSDDDSEAANTEFDLPHIPHPSPEAEELDKSSTRPSKRARVEEVEDEEAPGKTRWTEQFPFPAGTIIRQGATKYQEFRDLQAAAGDAPWAPFESQDEWELARWMMQAGISQKQTDKFIKLKKVRIYDTSVRMISVNITLD